VAGEPVRRRRAWPRRLALALIVLVVLAGGVTAWFLRDPTPYILERRSSLQRVEVVEMHNDGDHVSEHVRLHAANGLVVELAIRRPLDTVSVAARRLFLILGGHRAGKEAALVVPDTRGTVVAGLQYPYRGRIDVKGFAVVPQVPAIRQALLDTPPAVMLALDYLRARPEVDTSRVELLGASFGAPFATIAAALDSRVSRLWILHGAADPRALFDRGLERSIPWAPARSAVVGLATILSSAPRLDPARWVGRVSPRAVIMVNALDDERIPRSAVELLYASAGEPKEIHWLPGKHMQRNRRDVLTALVDTVMSLAARDTLPAGSN
jgi:hypothetical protein